MSPSKYSGRSSPLPPPSPPAAFSTILPSSSTSSLIHSLWFHHVTLTVDKCLFTLNAIIEQLCLVHKIMRTWFRQVQRWPGLQREARWAGLGTSLSSCSGIEIENLFPWPLSRLQVQRPGPCWLVVKGLSLIYPQSLKFTWWTTYIATQNQNVLPELQQPGKKRLGYQLWGSWQHEARNLRKNYIDNLRMSTVTEMRDRGRKEGEVGQALS